MFPPAAKLILGLEALAVLRHLCDEGHKAGLDAIREVLIILISEQPLHEISVLQETIKYYEET